MPYNDKSKTKELHDFDPQTLMTQISVDDDVKK